MEMQQHDLSFAHTASVGAIRHLRLVQDLENTDLYSKDLKKRESNPPEIRRSRVAVPPLQKVATLRGQDRTAGLKAIAPEHVERFLNLLRGEALLVGALSYGIGVRLSQLRFLRIRDVNLNAGVIELSDGPKQIPAALYEDLRDHISEKLCGRKNADLLGDDGHTEEPYGVQGGRRRDQLVFSHSAFEEVLAVCAKLMTSARSTMASQSSTPSAVTHSANDQNAPFRGQRVRDNFLRVMGWFHTKRAAKRGRLLDSPLGLFDKGPKIVRRDRGGVVYSYYLWRAVCSR